jgi:hypothetical protein
MQQTNAPAGWVIAVMVEAWDEPGLAPRYFAVAKPDQARAEWAAVDLAVGLGRVATSPVGGQEPVKAVTALTAQAMARLGLQPGTVQSLGPRLPRRWLA